MQSSAGVIFSNQNSESSHHKMLMNTWMNINLKDITNSRYKKELKDIKEVFLEIDVNISGLLREYNASMQTQRKEW